MCVCWCWNRICQQDFLFLYLQDNYSFILHTYMNTCSSYKRLEGEINFSNKNCLLDTKYAHFWLCKVCISFNGNTQCVLYVIMCATTQGNLNVYPCYSCSTDNSALCLPVTNQVFSLCPPFYDHQHEAQMCVLVGSLLPSDTHVCVRIWLLLLPYG